MGISNIERVELIDGSELTDEQRESFDYVDWSAIDAGTNSATFFIYSGQLFDMSNFMRLSDDHEFDAAESDSAFSATVIRLIDDETIEVARLTT